MPVLFVLVVESWIGLTNQSRAAHGDACNQMSIYSGAAVRSKVITKQAIANRIIIAKFLLSGRSIGTGIMPVITTK